MPEVLGKAGVYFDPTKSVEIVAALEKLLNSAELRSQNAQDSYEQVQKFSWQRCADETFRFLAQIEQQHSLQKHS